MYCLCRCLMVVTVLNLCVVGWTTKTQSLEANQNATGSELSLAKSEISGRILNVSVQFR